MAACTVGPMDCGPWWEPITHGLTPSLRTGQGQQVGQKLPGAQGAWMQMGLLFQGWSGRELPSPQALVPFPAWDLPPLCLLTKPGLGDILTFSYTFISFPNGQALTAPC